MYKIKFNAITGDYDLTKDGVFVKSFDTKPLAKEHVKELTTDNVIIQKSDVITDEEKTDTPKEEPKTEPKKDEITTSTPPEVKKTNSVFDLIVESTEEDKNGTGQFKNEEDDDDPDDPKGDNPAQGITNLANKLAEEDEDDDEISKKQSAKLTALLIVEMCGIGFSFLCQFIAKDFSKEAEKKYTLSEPKKKAIQVPLAKILELRKKKTSPVTSLIVAILLSFAPMIILAFADRRKKAEDEKEAAQKKESANNLAQQQFNAYKEQFLREQRELAAQKSVLEWNQSEQPKKATAKVKFAPQNNSAGEVKRNKDGSIAKKRGRKPLAA